MPVSTKARPDLSSSNKQWQTTVGKLGTRSVPQLMWWMVVMCVYRRGIYSILAAAKHNMRSSKR